MKKIVICSSSLLNDRMILYNDFLPVLTKGAEVTLWPASWNSAAYQQLNISGVTVEPFPKINPQAFGNQILRRFADYTWDHLNLARSRKVLWEETRAGELPAYHNLIRGISKGFASVGAANWVEKRVEKRLIAENRSPEVEERLKKLNPDLILIMSPFRMEEPGIAAIAKRLKIPVAALITTWDNLTTKNRIIFDYDAYFVWSEAMKEDLVKLYPRSRNKPIHIVGAPQFDMFLYDEFHISREEFCEEIGFNPRLPILLFALGSPNLFNELPGAEEFLERVNIGEAGDVQVIIRPHPLFKHDPKLMELTLLYDKVYIQLSTPKEKVRHTHDREQIREWVNTFAHSDVIIQLASTVAIDGAYLDRPVINIDFDPSGKKQSFVKKVNREMEHFAPLNKMNAFWMVEDYDEMVKAVNAYLKQPELHREGRAKVVKFVCGFTDGKCGKRFAEALLQEVKAKSQAIAA